MAHPVPAAKTALKALIDARAAWNSVDIRDEQPSETEDVTRNMAWFGPTDIPRDAWAWLGGQQRRIEFDLAFAIVIIREGDDPRATEDAAWALVEDLMLAVKSDPSLGGAVQQIGDMTGRMEMEPFDRMWRAAFAGTLAVTSKPY